MNPVITSTLSLTASLWLAGATVAIADPALAARSTDVRAQAIVNVADLDLHAHAGRITAQRRLRAAARSVCNDGDTRLDRGCFDRAIGQGERAINARTTGQIAAR